MIRYFFTVVFCLVVGFSFGQDVENDYRSNVAVGNWGTAGSWEKFVGGAWVTAPNPPVTTIPGNVVEKITIRAGHTITVIAAVSADQTTIQTGGTLVVNFVGLGVFNLLNGAGNDLVIEGTFTTIRPTAVALGATVINNGTMNVQGSTPSVTISGSLTNNGVLNVSAGSFGLSGASSSFTIAGAGTANLSGGTINLTNGSTSIGGTLNVSGGTLNVTGGTTTVLGIVNGSGGSINGTFTNLVFAANSTYNQLIDGTIPFANWQTDSQCVVTGTVSLSPFGLEQTFYNFIWDTPSLTTDVALELPDDFSTHNLTFTNTNGFIVFLSAFLPMDLSISGDLSYGPGAIGGFAIDQNVTINVGGNFNTASPNVTSAYGPGNVILNVTGAVNIASGVFDVSGTYPSFPVGDGQTTINVAGDFAINNSASIANSGKATDLDLNFVGSGVQNFSSTFVPSFPINYTTSNTSNLTIANGSFLAGPGVLTLSDNTFLSLLSEEASGALQDGTLAGNVRVLSRTYGTASTIVYAGENDQFISGDHPSGVNTRINITNNAASLTMLDDITFSGSLDMADGELEIGANTLTIAGAYTKTAGNLYPSVGPVSPFPPLSSLVINGTGAFAGDLVFFSGNSLVDFTIDRVGMVLPLGANLRVNGTFTLTEGDFFLASNTFTVAGPFLQTNGRISVDATSSFTLAGSGTFPTDIVFTGTAINTLRMDRAGTFATSSPLTINTLRLAAGSVSNSGNTLTMANGGLINRTFGSVLNPIGNVGTYSLRYGGVNGPISPGPELPVLPARAGVLQNFTVDNEFNVTNPNPGPGPNSHTLTLTLPIDAAGDFVITQGIVNTGNQSLNIGGNLSISAIGSIVPGTSTFTFDGGAPQTISSSAALNLTDLVVDQSASSSVTLLSQVNISNSFAVNSPSTVNIDGFLTLLSDGTTTAFIPELDAGATIAGSATAQRHLPNTNNTLAYRYITPVTTGTFVSDWKNDFPISGPFADPSPGLPIPNNPSLYYYDETFNISAPTLEGRYRNYPPTGVLSTAAPLVNGRGYAAWIRTSAPTMYDNTGGIRQHNVDIPVTNSGGVAQGGWNLIGNPYPAAVDWDLVLTDNPDIDIDGAIYFTDNTLNAGGLVTVSYAGGVSTGGTFNGIIAPGQGFWVHTPAGGIVPFRESHKVASQGQFLREGEISNLLRITMKHQNSRDEIALRLHEEASDSFDGKLDAFKFGATGLHISSLTKDNEKLSINAISSIGCDNTIPLQIDGGKTGSFTFDFTGIETFEPNVVLYLNDKVLSKQVDLSSSPQYAFSVSNIATLKNRFEIFIDRPSVETALTVTGESVCENNGLAYITLQNSQANVNYSAQWNGQTLSADVAGNGGQLQIPVPVENLTQGEHEFTILAKMANCDAVPLETKATLTVVKKGVIERVEEGTACEEGQVMITAFGDGIELYNWYEDVGSLSPIAGQNAATFTTPVLNKTKTYYVAAVNALGCEGERVPVKANVTVLEDVTIEAEGTILRSSYETGNQWYLDGLIIENATSNEIEATITGTYSVVATVGGCTTTAAREMVVTGIAESQSDFITVYPNPATDRILVQVKSVKQSLQAKLMSPIGVELNAVALEGGSEIKSGEFDLAAYPAGMYMVRIIDGKKVYTIKISKVK